MSWEDSYLRNALLSHSMIPVPPMNISDSDLAAFEAFRLDYIDRLRKTGVVSDIVTGETRTDPYIGQPGTRLELKLCGVPISITLLADFDGNISEVVCLGPWREKAPHLIDRIEAWQANSEGDTTEERFRLDD